MDEFELELKQGFLEKAGQLQNEVEQCFLSLESNPHDQSILEKIFRLAHNIKGSSKAVGFSELGAFTHEFESFILKLKNGEVKIDVNAVDLLLSGNDHLRRYLDALRSDLTATLDSRGIVSSFLNFRNMHDATIPVAPAAGEAVAPAAPMLSPDLKEFADLTTAHLPEAAPAAPSAQDREALVPGPELAIAAGPAAKVKAAAADESIRVSLARVEKLIDFVGEAVILQTVLREQGQLNPHIRRTVHQLGKVMKEVQDLSMGLRMLPIKSTFQKMQRIVRDTSGLLGKQVHLDLAGEETDVDKTVLESLGDPLVHMVRNAVDHGIESPEARMAAGKDPAGKIALRAFHQSGRLVIEIADDGGGISHTRLRKKAVEKGLLSAAAAEALSETEAVRLIFHPGFSTKTEVTEVSGRGVGMDVVKTNIEALQGEVTVETKEGQGSLFRVSLPLTLAIIEGMIVRAGGQRYVVPLNHVHESLKPGPGEVVRSSAIGEVLRLRGENLPVHRISKVLGAREPGVEEIAIVVRTDENPFALLVDDIVGQSQVVIKKLGAELASIRGFSGSAILGDGRPALILEVPELVKERAAA